MTMTTRAVHATPIRDGKLLGDVSKARIFFPDGTVHTYTDPATALAVYYALDRGVRAAFRAARDSRPVYPQDYVDRP